MLPPQRDVVFWVLCKSSLCLSTEMAKTNMQKTNINDKMELLFTMIQLMWRIAVDNCLTLSCHHSQYCARFVVHVLKHDQNKMKQFTDAAINMHDGYVRNTPFPYRMTPQSQTNWRISMNQCCKIIELGLIPLWR